ncbi:MAG: hypothetical protein DMF69_25060, partial [Acidobacteria bacterium]
MVKVRSNTKIRRLVESFLRGQRPRFSDVWKGDLVSRLIKLQSDEVVDLYLVKSVHEQKLQELLSRCERYLHARYTSLDHERMNNVVYEAFIKWSTKFDAAKAPDSKDPELSFLWLLSNQQAIKNFKDDHRTLEIPHEGRGEKRRPTARIVSLEDHLNEAANVRDPTTQKAIEASVFGNSAQQLLDENTADNRLVMDIEIPSSEVTRKKSVAQLAAREIVRYLLLTKRARFGATRHDLPEFLGVYRHRLSAFIDFHQRAEPLGLDLSLLNVGSVSGYFRMRNHILRTARHRRSMELAIVELKKSRVKRLNDLAKAKTAADKESILKAPILSSVAIAANGKVFTRFKGQVDETVRHG